MKNASNVNLSIFYHKPNLFKIRVLFLFPVYAINNNEILTYVFKFSLNISMSIL